jgi:hypothetical protein
VVDGGCLIWAASRMGKCSPSHFCDCLACAQPGVRPGIFLKKKDIFPVLIRTNSADALPQFKVFLYLS